MFNKNIVINKILEELITLIYNLNLYSGRTFIENLNIYSGGTYMKELYGNIVLIEYISYDISIKFKYEIKEISL